MTTGAEAPVDEVCDVSIRARVLVLCAVVLALPSVLFAATLDVCPSGCAYSTIQAAITAASAGDTIHVHAATYVENIVVAKPLTIVGGDDDARPVIMPAVSGATCVSGGGSLCDGGSTIILVQASGVTIENLTLDGDNPALTSGIVVGGADLDARNGIITDHRLGRFDNLAVRHVTVKNVFLRGIYASSGGTFAIRHNVVRNVRADYASIGIFNWYGSGVIADNNVSEASDAISSNHSSGVRFVGNHVRRSGSGVHTDNAGDSGGVADEISDNKIRDCTTDGYGIFAFVPYIAPSIHDNDVSGCAVGLAAFGQGRTVTTRFDDNRVRGEHATTSDGSSTIGVLVTTDILGYGATDVAAAFSRLSVTHFGVGVYVEQSCELFAGFFPGDCSGAATHAAVTIRASAIAGNAVGANGLGGTSVNAENNWWGCPAGPNATGCDTAIGTVDYTPWLTKPPKDR